MAGEYEDLAKEIVRAQMTWQREQTQTPKPAATWSLTTLFEKAPAWITLLAAAGVAYATLNTRMSTCEYQNQISIADRADLHRRLDKTDDTLTEVKSDLREIKVTLKELAERKRP